MYSIWRAARNEWEAWAVTRLDDGSTRPASTQELLDRHVVVVGEDEEHDHVYFQVGKLEWRRGDFPGRPLTAGTAQERFRGLPSRAREVCCGPGAARAPRDAAVPTPHHWLGEKHT